MELLRKFLDRNRTKKINVHVVGDAMIDEYYKVAVERISPEFPMPIMKSEGNVVYRKPGGAANVAYQFLNFNVCKTLYCIYDYFAYHVFGKHKITTAKIPDFVGDLKSRLPVKRRFLNDKIQIIRHDIEKSFCGLTPLENNKYVQDLLDEPFSQPDVAIFSDYNKGFFDADYDFLKNYSKSITIVDPKKGPIDKWKGCTVFKPNSKEARDLSGKTFWKDQVLYFKNVLECQSVVVTDGGNGVYGIDGDEIFCFNGVDSKAESVVGAGDAFCAFLAMSLGHKFSVQEASEIAWTAGSIYVQNSFNKPLYPVDLCGKFVDSKDLKNRDFKLVFSNGCFDILHEGHIKTLKFAKSKGDKLVVALNSDESVRRLKGDSRPVNSLSRRMEVIKSLEFVDYVISFEDDDPLNVIKDVQPDVLVKGGEYKIEDIVGHDFVPEVVTFPMVQNLSTTKILNHAKEVDR